jgi:hypothetical protein
MSTLRSVFTATTGALALGCVFALSAGTASALGLKDCSDKFSAAKAAGKAGNKTFADFMKSDCGDDAKPAATPAQATTPAKPSAPAATVAPVKPAAAAATTATPVTPPAATPPAMTRAEKRKAAKDARAAAAPATTTTAAVPAVAGSAVFPAKVSDTYASKKPSKARMSTCLDQYRANKASNGNGGLKWIQKGGGYYSQCNKKLKG